MRAHGSPAFLLSCLHRYETAGEKRPAKKKSPGWGNVIIPALEVIQPGLLWLCIAAGAKLGGKKLEITGAKSANFYHPGRGVTSPGTNS